MVKNRLVKAMLSISVFLDIGVCCAVARMTTKLDKSTIECKIAFDDGKKIYKITSNFPKYTILATSDEKGLMTFGLTPFKQGYNLYLAKDGKVYKTTKIKIKQVERVAELTLAEFGDDKDRFLRIYDNQIAVDSLVKPTDTKGLAEFKNNSGISVKIDDSNIKDFLGVSMPHKFDTFTIVGYIKNAVATSLLDEAALRANWQTRTPPFLNKVLVSDGFLADDLFLLFSKTDEVSFFIQDSTDGKIYKTNESLKFNEIFNKINKADLPNGAYYHPLLGKINFFTKQGLEEFSKDETEFRAKVEESIRMDQ